MRKADSLDTQPMYSDEGVINPELTEYGFSLSDKFLNSYKRKKVKWDALGYTTYKRSYARPKPDGTYEEWWETIQRVVETVYTIQKWYINEGTGSVWNEWKAQKSAQEMYERMFYFKFLPAGRGLFGMDTELLMKKGAGVLFSCAAASTEHIDYDFAMPFCWSMMMSFLGIGVGFDTRGAKKERHLIEPKLVDKVFKVKDSKEGWVEALEILLRAYSQKGKELPKEFDYSDIRPKGSPIKTFGGVAPGADPLKKLMGRVRGYLDTYLSKNNPVDSTLIVDIMTAIGEAVVSGGVRRSAMLALGDYEDKEFLNLKNYKEKADEIGDKPRWAANNSIVAKVGMDYDKIMPHLLQNGEPGLIYLENARAYSRTKDPKDYKDKGVDLVNPCVTGDTEIVLANGDSVKIKNLANKGDHIEVICVDDELKITTRTMRKPRCTGEKEVFEVRLKGHTTPIKATGNHKFMTPNGEYIQVKDMVPHETELMWKDTSIYTRREYQGENLEKALKNHSTKIVASIKSAGVKKVYNGTVDDFHNYIVLPERIMHSHPEGVRDLSMVDYISKFGLVSRNCGEIGLESYGLCNLVDIFLPHNDDLEDLKKTIKYAYLYGKTVTLLKTHSPVTNGVIMNTRRIGIGMSGIVQAIEKSGYRNIMNMLDDGYNDIEEYDRIYSSWFGVPLSLKKTTVKPSGCQTGDTLVTTDQGVFRLDELGDTKGETWQDISEDNLTDVYTKDSIDKFFINGKEKTQTKLFTLADGTQHESSLEHKYRIYRGEPKEFTIEKSEWVPAFDINIGDYFIDVVGGYNKKEEPKLITDLGTLHGNTYDISMPKKMSPKLAWLIGMIYGDGSIHKKNIRISFNRKDASLVKYIHDLVKELFGLETKIDNDHSIYIYSKSFKKFLMVNNMLKSYSHDMEIPKVIRESSAESILAFIEGMWRADGGTHNISSWTVCTVSEAFARQLQILGKSIGLFLRIKNAGPGGIGSRDRWILNNRNFTDWDIYKHAPKKDRERVHKMNDSTFYMLNACDKIDVSENYTYDIEVNDNHQYIANGVISHNSISLLAGVTPGIHFPHSKYYWRTIRVQKTNPILQRLIDAGYRVEDAIGKEEYVSVVYFPIETKYFTKSKDEATVWEQMALVNDVQRYWSDNLISVTISFDPDKEGHDIKRALEMYEDKLKGISFLPNKDHGYEQMPYQKIDEDTYNKAVDALQTVSYKDVKQDEDIEDRDKTFCDSDKCGIDLDAISEKTDKK